MTSEEKTQDGAIPAQPTCHMLPCSVDFSGRVQGAQHFFQPTLVEGDLNRTSKGRLLAATLRGRGMLGEESDSQTALRVFKVSAGDQTLTVEGPQIKQVVEWQHEHVPENINHTKSRIDTAHAWVEVAHALHEPLPPPEQF